MRCNAISPFATVGHKTPIEDNAGFARPTLPYKGKRNCRWQVFHRMQEFELVTHGQVVIRTWLQAFYVLNEQVCFKGMASAARGDCAQSRVRLPSNVFNSLGCPEKKRELEQADGLLGVNT